MWLVMRRIWDHAEQRLAPYSLSLKHNWALHALDEPMSMSALADRLGHRRLVRHDDRRPARGARPHRAPAPSDRPAHQEPGPDAGGPTAPRDGSRTSSGSTSRCSTRSQPTNDANSGGCSRGPSTRHREAKPARPRPDGGPTAGWLDAESFDRDHVGIIRRCDRTRQR